VTEPGLFVAFEGGEGSGKSTQITLLAQRLRAGGREVVTTFEPGGTVVGAAIRQVLLSRDTQGLAPRAEALLFAADRAQHVDTLVRPALRRGAVVLTDRYMDSSIAYQGAGRELSVDEIRKLSEWATDELLPDLTVLLDVDPVTGLQRAAGETDRLEAEPLQFHNRVRQHFLALAAAEPNRYVVLDAAQPVTEIAEAAHAAVLARVAG